MSQRLHHPQQADFENDTEAPRLSPLRKAVVWATLFTFTIQPLIAAAQVVADSAAGANKPQVGTTASGLPIVQIVAPNGAGVSHNKYQQFNVDPQGLILNNSAGIVSTQLAGYVDGNPNLAGGTARIILNEVTSTNPSVLQGYTEVAGAKADVIVANPNGITCNGCGFINTTRGVLTTGTPVFGGSGSLDAFRVTGGQITVGGTGLNANNIDQVDLIARAVTVNAQVQAGNLNVIAGANQVNYANLGIQTIAGSGSTPTVAIDVSALGGMYANKIRLVGTEAGVGVRSLGSIASRIEDISISSNGDLTLSGNTSSAANINLSSSQNLTNTGTLYGQGNVGLIAGSGITSNGTLAAGGNLTLQAATLNSNGILASGLRSDGTFGASGDITATVTGAASLQGQTLAAGNLNVTAATIGVANSLTQSGQGANLVATQGDIDNTGGSLIVGGTLNAQAQGNILNAANAGIGGTISAGALNLSGTALDNRGGSILQTGSANTTMAFSGAVDNTGGTIGSNGTNLTFSSGQLTNIGGQLLHGGNGLFSLRTDSLDNTGGTISGNGQVGLVTQGFVNNGTVAGNAGLNITASTITNNGTLSSNGVLGVASGAVTNNGSMTAYGAFSLTASSLANSGTLATHDALSLNISSNLQNTNSLTAKDIQGAIGGSLTNTGLLAADNSLNLTAGSITNGNSLRSNNTLTLSSTGALSNSGTLASASSLTLNAASLGNTGSMSADTVHASVTGTLTNGGTLAGNTLLDIGAASVNNTNSMSSNGDLALTSTGALTNSGTFTAGGNETLTLSSLNNSGQMLGNGVVNMTAGNISNGGTLYGGSFNINGANLTNTGTLASLGDMGLQLTTTLTNSGSILAGGNATFYLNNLYNQPNATIWAGNNLTIARDAAGNRASFVQNDRADIETQNGDMLIKANQFSNLGADPSPYVVGQNVYDAIQMAWRFPVYAAEIARAPSFYNYWVYYVPSLAQYQSWLPYTQIDKRVYFVASGYVQTLSPGFVAQPGKIHSGHNLSLDVGTGTNQYSNITATNNISLTGGSFTNTGYALYSSATVQPNYESGNATVSGSDGLGDWPDSMISLPVLSSTQYHPGVLSIIGAGGTVNVSGLTTFTNNNGQTSNGYISTGSATAYAGPTASSGSTGPGSVTTPTVSLGNGVTLSPSGQLNFSGVPTGGLFVLAPANNPNYLIETNPLFANYSNFLSSDYMLNRLGLDPSATEKRLGDGFYEQRLVREQITQMTGRPYLANANNEDDYRQLLNNAVAYAQTYHLTPGIALSAGQMANLTSDMVWLEDRVVGGQHVLVPQLYLAANSPARLEATGAVVIANDINIGANTITNSGTFTAKNTLNLNAVDFTNQNGIVRGDTTQVVALNNLTSQGGQISGNKVSLAAGTDLNLNATQVQTQSSLDLSAGRDLTLGTITEHYAASHQSEGDSQSVSGTTQRLTSLQSNGTLSLAAGRDLTSIGASITAEGDGSLTAGRNVTLDAAKEQYQAHSESHKGSWSRSDTSIDKSSTTYTGTSVSVGGKLDVIAGNDTTLRGSTLAAQNDVSVSTGGNLTLTPTTNTQSNGYQHSESKTGFFSSGAMISFGTRTQEDQLNGSSATQTGSLIGSVAGNVTLDAGKRYTQTASTVMAPQGDISVTAQAVDIGAAWNQFADSSSHKESFTGFSVGISNPVVSAVQTTQQMALAAGQTTDPRMKALAAATAALATKNAYDAVKAGQAVKDGKLADQVGGINVSVSFGSSKSESSQSSSGSQAVGSTLAAGNNLTVMATGDDLNVVGSNLSAGNDATLAATGKVNLLAAANTSSNQSNSSSSGASVGVGFSLGAKPSIYATASAYRSSDNGNGQDTTWTNTQASAGNTLLLASGTDTNLKGAVASGKQVIADVGGNFNIESLQDTSTYKESGNSAGFSVSVPIWGTGSGFSASVNAGKTNINSDYRSANTQSGIQAGDNGFDVTVQGNTDLKGAVIASTDKAIQDNKNSLVTGTLTTSDLQNKAEYSGQRVSLGVGYGNSVGKDQQGNPTTGAGQIPNTALPSLNGFSATLPVAMSASGNAESTTRSAISGGQIGITDDARQQALTGKDATQTVASLNRDTANASASLAPIFDKNQVKTGFEITGAFVQQVGSFLENRAKETTQAKKALDNEQAKPVDQQDQAKIAQLTQVLTDNQTWEMGGTGRIALTAVTTAFSGNVTGSGAELMQTATVRALQALGAQEIKQLAGQLGGEGSPAHTALHSVLACAGAAAASGDCGTAALAASAGVVVNKLLDGIEGKDADKLTAEEKDARANLITTLVTGVTAAVGGDAAVANATTRIETENNGLKEFVFPPNLPKMPFRGYVKKLDGTFAVVSKQASIDKEKRRIILIEPGESVLSTDRALYAAGTGGDEIPGYTVIFAHASDKSIQGVSMTDPVMFNQFVDMIKNSGAWEPGRPIMIDACNAGRVDTGIASALAKALSTTVVAATTQTWNIPLWSTSGITGAFEPTTPKGGTPNIQAPGKWNTFGPDGSIISTSKYPPNAPFPPKNP